MSPENCEVPEDVASILGKWKVTQKCNLSFSSVCIGGSKTVDERNPVFPHQRSLISLGLRTPD